MFKQSTNIIVAGLILFTAGAPLHPMQDSIESPDGKFSAVIVDKRRDGTFGSYKEWTEIALQKKETETTLFQGKLMGANLNYIAKFDRNSNWFYALNRENINLVNLITGKKFRMTVESSPCSKFEFNPESTYAFSATEHSWGKITENHIGCRKKMVRLINLVSRKYICLDCSRKAKCTFDSHDKTFHVKDGEKSRSFKLDKEFEGFTSDLKEIS